MNIIMASEGGSQWAPLGGQMQFLDQTTRRRTKSNVAINSKSGNVGTSTPAPFPPWASEGCRNGFRTSTVSHEPRGIKKKCLAWIYLIKETYYRWS